jgi:hypothetical protein
MTYWYEVYGIRLRSDIELSFAAGLPAGEPDIDLISATESFFREISRDAVLKPTSYGWYQYALLDDDQIYLRWDGMFEFVVAGDGRRLWFGPLGTNSVESLQVYLLGRALSFALVKQGFEPIHSTAIVLDGGALAFLGESGYGKSSLAAGFLGDGYRLLTDDLLLVSQLSGRPEAQPGPPRIKLFPWVARRCLEMTGVGVPMTNGSDKLVLPLGEHHHHNRPAPLRTIYVLSGPREVFRKQRIQIATLSPREAFVELMRHTFNYVVTDPKRLRQLFSKSQQLASRVPVKRISYPRDLALLPEVRDRILADLADDSHANDKSTEEKTSMRA